jgi:hypothetical protein
MNWNIKTDTNNLNLRSYIHLEILHSSHRWHKKSIGKKIEISKEIENKYNEKLATYKYSYQVYTICFAEYILETYLIEIMYVADYTY